MAAIGNVLKKSLKSTIIDLIQLKGPITVSEYMKIVLTNPSNGFYMNNDVFGVKGHFTTSPEVSQIFGEVMGAWILQEWRRFNSPRPLRLVEFGPGRGTLMSDVSRTIKKLQTDVEPDLEVRLIEVSKHLKDIQKKNVVLKRSNNDSSDKIRWYQHIEELDENENGFSAFIAHEFLDALPIHKFVRDPSNKKWRELMIDYNEKHDLIFRIASQPSLSTKLLIPNDFVGDHIEVCPQAALTLEKVAKHINKNLNGCMLICDYGFENDIANEITNGDEHDNESEITQLKPIRSARDTFRAFKNHEIWHPLSDPGDADITADVDFGYLKNQLSDKANLFGPVDQRTFLLRCGLQARLEILLRNAKEDQRDELISGVKMITEDMGERYKFLAMFPKGTEHLFKSDPPAGFDK